MAELDSNGTPTGDGWRPMDSAPIDGTEFLVTLSNGWIEILSAHSGITAGHRYSWWNSRGRLSIPYEPSHEPSEFEGHFRAIRWQPLPAPHREDEP